jgi:rhomboid family GlyGly-CTERM serine protease
MYPTASPLAPTVIAPEQLTARDPQNAKSNPADPARRRELIFFITVLLVLNLPMLLGHQRTRMVFQPGAVRTGEWWRLFTHPFVHVSWLHFLLDGTAFLALYHGLAESSLIRRLSYVAASTVGSILISSSAAPAIEASGLCGLSGIAHGLMAISALELISAHSPGTAERRIGWSIFGIVFVKAAFEAISGRMFFQFLEFGLLGSPVAVSHAGGIIGALLAWLVLQHGKAMQKLSS